MAPFICRALSRTKKVFATDLLNQTSYSAHQRVFFSKSMTSCHAPDNLYRIISPSCSGTTIIREAVSHESKGLSEDLISRLPTFKYRTGLLSKKKKKKKKDCVICYSKYRNGAWLITLLCTHQYHAGCISHWLKLNKICPVCQVEV